MKFASKALWLIAAAVALSAAPAYALTVWQAAPNNGSGAQNFADPDSGGSQSGEQPSNASSQKGWNFQFGAASQDGSQSRSFSGPPGDPMFRPYHPQPRNPDSPYSLR